MASQDWFEKDFYKILGVAKDVSDAELKKVYRKLARQYHPDSNQGDAKAEGTAEVLRLLGITTVEAYRARFCSDPPPLLAPFLAPK